MWPGRSEASVSGDRVHDHSTLRLAALWRPLCGRRWSRCEPRPAGRGASELCDEPRRPPVRSPQPRGRRHGEDRATGCRVCTPDGAVVGAPRRRRRSRARDPSRLSAYRSRPSAAWRDLVAAGEALEDAREPQVGRGCRARGVGAGVGEEVRDHLVQAVAIPPRHHLLARAGRATTRWSGPAARASLRRRRRRSVQGDRGGASAGPESSRASSSRSSTRRDMRSDSDSMRVPARGGGRRAGRARSRRVSSA
jgi:hypothetical protein